MKTFTKLIAILSGIILISPTVSFSQNNAVPGEKKITTHNEIPGDPYLPNAYGNLKTTPAKTFTGSNIFTTQVNVNASGQNIVGDAGNEPSLAVNASDPTKMVIGWRQFDNIGSNFRQAGWAYSNDAGHTWTFPGKIEAGTFRSDPVLDYDNDGNFYYNSLTSNVSGYFCKVFKSSNGGSTWNSGSDAAGGDKQWMTIDRTTGVGAGNIYSFWTSYYSSCIPGNFTRSTDGGSTFESCVEVTGDPYWGTMAVGNNGELYIAGSAQFDGIQFAKSTNAMTPGSTVAWDFSQYVDIDGYITSQTQVNPVGLLGQASVDVDRSNGPGRGNIYVLASVMRLSTGDPADVMLIKSTDGGQTWNFPVQVNDDGTSYNWQWFGTMSVAPNGRIDAVWLDTRNDPTNADISELYYSYSLDQGDTWSVNEKLSLAFNPHVGYPQQDKIGDYFDMQSDNGGAHLAWANTLNGEEDVYYSYIRPPVVGTGSTPKNENYLSVSCYPNPFRDLTTIRYQVPAQETVILSIFNVYGQEITTLVNKVQPAGIYTVSYAAADLPAGYYYCRLTSGSATKTASLVKVK
ncbi:MAG: T9SS type A sorting domain-containing protein [Bacteroidetes bacterium]|nr:T9SS type A sorting domain-containing protein [Bacteroidota bacterium]